MAENASRHQPGGKNGCDTGDYRQLQLVELRRIVAAAVL
jgi:hypothetical protein